MSEDLQPVLVTTVHRGVFFGYLVGPATKERVVLKQARNCLSWTNDLRGIWGLASSGPTPECRVGPAVPELILIDITAVAVVTPAAVDRWESAPWK